ncbi:hypothetical protein EON82_14960, partial [bacterium]
MKSLHTVHAHPHEYGCDVGMSGIDLFTSSGGYFTLQTDMQALRQILRNTHCNLVRLVTPDSHSLTLIGGWPHPWHASRITLNEVSPDELVRVHTRVSLLRTPEAVTDGGWTLVKEAPWIQVYGEAGVAGASLTASFRAPSEAEIRAPHVALPEGVRLASPS